MQDATKYKLLIAALIISLLVLGQKFKEQRRQKQNLESRLDDYSSALGEANDNIDEANSYIEDAKSSAWSSYEDMGNALENLQTVSNVSEP